MIVRTFPKPAPKVKRRRRTLPPRSEAAQRFADELEAIRPVIVARSHGLCECCGDEPGVVLHHRKRRSQGGPNTLANLVLLSDAHHLRVHANPDASYLNGLLIRRDAPITPYGANR